MSKNHPSKSDHKQSTAHHSSRKKPHHTLLFIVAMGLMLAGIVMYVMSGDEADLPDGTPIGEPVQAAAGP